MIDNLGTNLVLGLFLLAAGHHCAPVDQNTDVGAINVAVPNNRVNGESLIEVGQLSHLDFVEMIGNAVKNAEALSVSAVQTLEDNLKGDVSALKEQIKTKMCEIEPCTLWSHWSECSASPLFGTFGIKRRSRTCWLNETSTCHRSWNGTIEDRAEICNGNICPSPYEAVNRNTSSLCLQFHTTRKDRDSAEAICQENGGHILNPDTEDRWQVAKEYRKQLYVSVWLDGKRTNSSSPFIYMNGVEPEKNGLSYWILGEPGSSDTCKVVDGSGLQWFGRSCSSGYIFICEKRAV